MLDIRFITNPSRTQSVLSNWARSEWIEDWQRVRQLTHKPWCLTANQEPYQSTVDEIPPVIADSVTPDNNALGATFLIWGK